jgi:hypothetical protein
MPKILPELSFEMTAVRVDANGIIRRYPNADMMVSGQVVVLCDTK